MELVQVPVSKNIDLKSLTRAQIKVLMRDLWCELLDVSNDCPPDAKARVDRIHVVIEDLRLELKGRGEL